MKKALLLGSFFISTPLFIFFCIAYLSFLTFQGNKSSLGLDSHPPVAYAALPSMDSEISSFIEQEDSRIEIVRQFLTRYGSPLVPHASDTVKYADVYGIDFRLVPAIGMQESNLCRKTPQGSNNCWGYGIYGKKVLTFESYSEAIETVTRGLARNYVNIGLRTPEEIQKKYTPSNDGSWARSVNHFMAELQ